MNSCVLSTGWPSIAVTRSPPRRPARSAGLRRMTDPIRTPAGGASSDWRRPARTRRRTTGRRDDRGRARRRASRDRPPPGCRRGRTRRPDGAARVPGPAAQPAPGEARTPSPPARGPSNGARGGRCSSAPSIAHDRALPQTARAAGNRSRAAALECRGTGGVELPAAPEVIPCAPGPASAAVPLSTLLAASLAASLASSASALAGIAVTGRVLGPSGAPLPEAQVMLLSSAPATELARLALAGATHGEPLAGAVTDARGGFRLEAPRAGLYSVRIEAAGHAPVQAWIGALVEEAELPDAALEADAGLTVTVSGAEGEPLAGALVVVRRDATVRSFARFFWNPAARVALSGPDGTARLPRGAKELLIVGAAALGARARDAHRPPARVGRAEARGDRGSAGRGPRRRRQAGRRRGRAGGRGRPAARLERRRRARRAHAAGRRPRGGGPRRRRSLVLDAPRAAAGRAPAAAAPDARAAGPDDALRPRDRRADPQADPGGAGLRAGRAARDDRRRRRRALRAPALRLGLELGPRGRSRVSPRGRGGLARGHGGEQPRADAGARAGGTRRGDGRRREGPTAARSDRHRDRERPALRRRPADDAARLRRDRAGRPGAHGRPGTLPDRRARSGARLHRGRGVEGIRAGRGRGQRPAPAADEGRGRAGDEARRARGGADRRHRGAPARRRRDPRRRDTARGRWPFLLLRLRRRRRLPPRRDDRRRGRPSRSPTSSPGATT